jgi:hypothetical protein
MKLGSACRRATDALKSTWSTLRQAETWARVLAFAGGVSTTVGLVDLFWPGLPARVGRVALGAAGAAVAAVVVSTTLRSGLVAVSTGGWRVRLVVGDLFDSPQIVVTADREFSHDSSNIGRASLIAQLLARLNERDRAIVRDRLRSVAKATPAEPGTAVTLSTNGLTVTVVAVSSLAQDGTSTTTWSELWTAYDGLWHHIRAEKLEAITVPVIGAGFAGSSLDAGSVLGGLVVAFHSASMERRVCANLTVVLQPEHAGLIAPASRLLTALGYTTHRVRSTANRHSRRPSQ